MIPTITALALMSIAYAPTAQADAGTERTYAGASKQDVWRSVMASLEANDLPVVAADFDRGKIRVRQHDYLDSRWAACPDIDRQSFDPTSPSNLGVRTAPLYRGVDLRLEITGATTGTQLALDPRYYDVGRDGNRRRFAFQVTCRSTGVLEQTLFEAAKSPN